MDIRHLDWDAIVDRYETAFHRENHDRPVLHVSFANGKTPTPPPAPVSIRERWFNFDWRIDAAEAQFEGIDYLCEGFPTLWCNLGPDVLAGFMGCDLDFSDPGTSWAKPRVADWAAEPPLRFHRDGWLWQQMEKYLRLAAARGAGRWLTGSGDLHTNADGLAALRGPDNLLIDLIDRPDEIKKRLRECHDVFRQVFQAHIDIIHPPAGGCNSSWMDATCRGKYLIAQNDFSCMVSREMFDEFFGEYVEKEALEADHTVYHLDGPNALQHTETICAAPHLDLVQWVPGAGHRPLPEWPDVLKKIHGLGKGLWLYGNAKECTTMMEYLPPEGCIYRVGCGSRDEAESLVRFCRQRYGC